MRREKRGKVGKKTQHPFPPFFVMKTVTQLLKSNPQCCCEYLRGLQWRDTPVHEQNNRFKMENRLITCKYYCAKSCTKPYETLGNRGNPNHAFMVSPINSGCLFTDSGHYVTKSADAHSSKYTTHLKAHVKLVGVSSQWGNTKSDICDCKHDSATGWRLDGNRNPHRKNKNKKTESSRQETFNTNNGK